MSAKGHIRDSCTANKFARPPSLSRYSTAGDPREPYSAAKIVREAAGSSFGHSCLSQCIRKSTMTSRTHDGGDAPAWCDLKHTLHRAFRFFEVANQCTTYRDRHRCVGGVRLVA